MTFRQLLADHRDRFHPQTWYAGERFLDWPCAHPIRLPTFESHPDLADLSPVELAELPRAVLLAELFLKYPNAPLWGQYLWTCDVDQWGQRVYVGGACPENGHRLEIHRHLQVTDKWGLCRW